VTLAADLVAYVEDQLTRLVERHLPGFRVPGAFAGHQVLPDVRADLAFTLGLLRRNGVQEVAGLDVQAAVERVLLPIDGPGTHSFASYRVAETLAAVGMADPLPPNVVDACDSTSFIALLLDGKLPRNYAAVLARCELARQRIGLLDDDTALLDLVERTRALLAPGHLDDSQSGIGRYDIYTADIALFTEPLGDHLGPVWDDSARRALDLVARTMAPDGTAVGWGRSSGALAACLTIELGGLARRLDVDADAWHGRGALGFDGFRGWMTDGLINAHQHRSTYGYRGPHRRLQMTLDCLGKLAAAALDLAGADPSGAPELFPDRDELVPLDEARNAAVWSYRSADLAFVLPLVGSTVSDYLPAPHQPGLFEVPVGTDLPTGVPMVFSAGVRHTAGQLPATVEKRPGGLTLGYDGLARSGQFEDDGRSPALPGRREVTYRVEGRTLAVEEVLHLEDVPEAVTLQVAETTDRPLVVEFSCDSPHATTTVDTSGLKEWRSFWAELPRVHQIDVDPATDLRLSYRVTPKLRVLTNARRHHYHRSLYDPLADRVVEGQLNLRRGTPPLGRWDLFHLHWPEWLFGTDVERHRAFLGELAASGVRIVWTAHNLVPHDRDPAHLEAYRLWAAAADGVIHHSRWGMQRVRERYEFRPDAVHRVIPHGHFGNLHVPADRVEVERELGLTPGKVRLAVVGAPRPEKDTAMVVEAFAAAGRDDLELLVLSLGPDDVVPDVAGVVARPYEFVDVSVYRRRLAAVDVLVLPFAAGEMLTTGTVGDAIGLGVPSISSDWPYLTEVLGDAAIVYGQGLADLTDCFRTLDRDGLERARAAAVRLQPAYDWATVAASTHDLLEAVGTTRL
jgi:glycosyltransferase involved in cell wall biosynthesis